MTDIRNRVKWMGRAAARARTVSGLIVMLASLLLAAPALAQEAPDALVKRVSQEALAVIKSDPKVQAGDQARIREVIETKLTPYFDVDRMTALAAGRAYRSATPEQKKRLAEEFKTLLIRTYSTALNQYRDQTLDYKPLRADPNATDVTVRTEVIRPGQPPVDIDYSMGKTPGGWKAYDVIVGGVSLVTNYRDEFTREVQAGGVDGLIKSLAAKNSGGTAK
jgi:phospholipid transport system substrate-binding protein